MLVQCTGSLGALSDSLGLQVWPEILLFHKTLADAYAAGPHFERKIGERDSLNL